MSKAGQKRSTVGRRWKYKVCRCCGQVLTGEDCKICGFPRASTLDDAFLTEEMQRSNAYRRDILQNLTDFSVYQHQVRWDSSAGQYVEEGSAYAKIADGKDCMEKTVWGDSRFAQSPEEEIPAVSLKLCYSYRGKKIPLAVPIQPVRCNDFWRIGLRIERDFTLCVFLGTPDCFASAEPVSLFGQNT